MVTENGQSDGNTSFLRAARNGQLDKVLEHLKTNIDINTSNANGLNALHLASKDGHVDIVAELLKRGAVVDAATKKGNTALHIASLAGQEEVVKLLVQHGASVNVQSQNGFTPLYMAAQENHDNVVKYLLTNGANQSLSTEDGFTPLAVAMQQGHDKVVTVLLENDTRGKVRLPALHIAAKKDDVKAAKLLLENEHNPDVTSKSGFTPLHIASHYGNQQIANILIQKGADINYAAKHNITPLHVAAKWGKANMVGTLIENGATIESKTRDGLTPLHCAARSGHEQVVDMLLEKGAPISSKTKNGLAPLHMAAQGDHVDAARILLLHRAPVDEVTVDYLTALHVAAHCGHVRVAKLLLDRQADANARALNGFTPLHIACKKNRIKVVELLLKHGASIGATTESGLTPLHVASFMGCMNIVIYLLQHDASPDAPTVRGETPLHLAARANQTDIIRILLRNGAQVDARAREQQTPLHIASRLGNVDIVMLLLQHGAKVDNTTKDMYTSLHIAAKEGQDEVATVLIDNGASLDAKTKKGFTPLHLAAKYGHLKVAKLLLQKEAPVDAQGKNGVTPLHVASHYDHQNVALLLLDKGASPHATAKNGHTPLHITARKNQMDVANTLLEYGAHPNAESKAGFTPLHLSAQEGHADMTSLLLEHKAEAAHQAKNGLTPLHLCAQEDQVATAEILVKNGANVDSVTKTGYTPLHVACHYGHINMVKFLLANGANVQAESSLGYTPLHQAAQQGHTNIVNILLEHQANPNAVTNNGQTPYNIANKLGYITVIETLKVVTSPTSANGNAEEKYRVVAPEAMHENFMSDSEEEGGEDTLLGDQTYRYLTADEMKSLGDDSLPIDVTRDERIDSNRMVTSSDSNMLPPQNIEDTISPEHVTQNYVEYIKKYQSDNVDIAKHPINIGKLHWKNFLVSFLVDARGGAMRGCRHSGVRVIVPPRSAPSPTRITCRYVRPQRTPHPPPLMEGEALASRVLELGPVGAKFLGPVIIEVPHFAALRDKEREIVILRSDNGESWKEHTVEAKDEILNDVLHDSFEAEDLSQLEDMSSGRITRILTQDFPQYFAVVSRIRQEVHAIGPEGGMVSSTVVPQVQAVFPEGALTKKIKVGLQAQPIDPELTAKLLGHGVAVSPVVTVEPRRRKFHKAITLSMPAPRAHSQGMINQYSGSAPTLRLLCSITGGTTRAQWEDVTGSTPLTFVNDCVSFTTTVSARFWLMDCRNISDATKMATELYKEAIHVPFMAKFVVFAKRVDPLEARLRVFCMTDDKEDKTLEHQEHFTEVAKSRDVEVLEGKPQYIEFAGNLVPITKSGEQLQFAFRAFRENRLPFSVRVKDQHAEAVGRCLFMKEPKVLKGEPPQQPICILNIVLPVDIISETIILQDHDTAVRKHNLLSDNFDYYRPDPRLADISNLLGEDWVQLAIQLGLTPSEINVIKSEYPPDSIAKQGQSMLRMWISQSGNKAQTHILENALRIIGREDIIPQCLNIDHNGQPITRIISKEELEKHSVSRQEASLQKNISDTEQDYKIHDKYSAEEKAVEISDEEEDFNKTVVERRQLIEERMSSDRTIPASSQRVEIVQEITTIKRQSLVEDKIAEAEKGTYGGLAKTDEQISQIPETNDFEKSTTTTTTTTTTESVTKITHKEDETTNLVEGVTQRFGGIKTGAKLIDNRDSTNARYGKTPPPSPADFLTQQAAIVQDWDADQKPTELQSVSGSTKLDAAPQEISCSQLTEAAIQLTPTNNKQTPQPRPRTIKTPDKKLQFSPKDDDDDHVVLTPEKQISPVRDDLLDETQTETYTDKKTFWENLSKDAPPKGKRMSMQETSFHETSQVAIEKRMSVHEFDIAPTPKPRTVFQQSQSVSEERQEEIFGHSILSKSISLDSEGDHSPIVKEKILSEYQASFLPPDQLIKTKIPECPNESTQSMENTGYISDSEDVEHYISDSEIEDRVPQIRERQMSVFAPPTTTRKSIYERSASLPTEDLYEVSAQSIKLRKQYYEEQIKKEMIEEQLASEIEDNQSPEIKLLTTLEESDETVKSVKDLAKEFDTTQTNQNHTPLKDLQSTTETNGILKEEDEDEEEEYENSTVRTTVKDLAKDFEKQLGNVIAGHKIETIPQKHEELTVEMHVDKSETEDSEKKADVDHFPESVPEITVTLSGKQRRISEEDETEDEQSPTSIKQPEQHVEDTIWEAPIYTEPQLTEKTVDITNDIPTVCLRKTDSESRDDSDSIASEKIKSESYSDIEKIILESLHQQKVDPQEAKKIATALIQEIESEISKTDHLHHELQPSEQTKVPSSDYLRHLAETKGLDEREVELVESVLARRQRELNKLSRGDTQASSMEITDEDLKYSGTDLDYSNLLEQQIDQLEAENVHMKFDESATDDGHKEKFEQINKTNEIHVEEKRTSDVCDNRKISTTTTSTEAIKGEKVSMQSKDVIFEEDETISESITEDSEKVICEKKIEERQEILEETPAGAKIFDTQTSTVSSEIDVETKQQTKIVAKDTDISHFSLLDKTDQKTEIENVATRFVDENSMLIKDEASETSLESKTERSYEETLKTEDNAEQNVLEQHDFHPDGSKTTTIVETEVLTSKTSSSVIKTDLEESKCVITKFQEDIAEIPAQEIKTTGTIDIIKRTSSSDSKSSLDSGKEPDDIAPQIPEESSGIVFRKSKSDAESSSSSSNIKDRKSGVEFEAYSSSGESHYHSFEIDSGKSRPCSSDVEGLMAAGSSEYESALTSQILSGKSHITTTEYQTAVSSLSSKESMKSLDSESSGNLASIEVSEVSETLIPSSSDIDGDILDLTDQVVIPEDTSQSNWKNSGQGTYESTGSIDMSEEDVDTQQDTQSKMKRSYEMTFQPEPKLLQMESPQAELTESYEKLGTSLDDSGSVLSVSVSSTSSNAAVRTIIEFSKGEDTTVSGASEQVSFDEMENLSREAITTSSFVDMSTSTQSASQAQIESVTISTSTVKEDGIQSVSTQVTTLQEDYKTAPLKDEPKKKGHRRQDSNFTNYMVNLPAVPKSAETSDHQDIIDDNEASLSKLSIKEGKSDEKKDVDECEKYDTDVPQELPLSILETHRSTSNEETSLEPADIIVRSSPDDDQIERPYSPELKDDTPEFSSEAQASVGELEQEYSMAVQRSHEINATDIKRSTKDITDMFAPPKQPLEKKDSHGKSSTTSSEKSSFDDGEAEAAFSMVAHISPAHKIKQICPIMEDEDAEKHELETREKAQKEIDEKKAQMKDQAPGFIPDIKVTQHMTPLIDRNFRYPDLELEAKEKDLETQMSTPQTPASNSSKSSEETDQGQEYVLDETIPEEPEPKQEDKQKSDVKTGEGSEKGTDSPNSDSFEMLEKPDLIDDFVVIEEVAKEAHELDSEGKSVKIEQGGKRTKLKHDTEVEEYLVKSAPTPLTKITQVKYYPEGSNEELGFEFEDSPPQNNKGGSNDVSSKDYIHEYDRELEANKKWIEQQFQGDQAAMMAAGYGYEMEFERGPLEDIKEEDITDFEGSSRIGSLGSQKESGGSLGSVKDSYSSTPEYDVLAGRKYFTRSGEHDDISMSSLQEFENLEQAMSLEMRKYHGSQDSSSNGSYKNRYHKNQGDDISVSSLKEFEGLEKACIAAHKVDIKVKEEEEMLTQIDEGPESVTSESESCETISGTQKQATDSDEEDYEKRMFEIDEIIRQAQTNVERFIDLKEVEKTESLGRGDSIEEVSKVPDLDLDAPLVKSTVKVQWKEGDDVMVTSTDSLDLKPADGSNQGSTDSLEHKTGDIMTTSTDSIENQAQSKSKQDNIMTDSIEIKNENGKNDMISSDSLELGAFVSSGNNLLTDSIDEDGSRVFVQDISISSTSKDCSTRDELLQELRADADPTEPSITSSTATHATYQYETDSVLSSSFTSAGSNTMVSSTENIDPLKTHAFEDVSVAVRKVWFDEDEERNKKVTDYIEGNLKPYVTEIIEPTDEDGFSYTIQRKVELPGEIRQITFTGDDAEAKLKDFIEKFNEGEEVHETEEIDEAGNVHIKKVVTKKVIIKSDETSDVAHAKPKVEGIVTKTLTDSQGSTTTYTKQFDEKCLAGYEATSSVPSDAASTSKDQTGEKQTDDKESRVSDQHQLSKEMQELLAELEKQTEH